MIYNIYPKKDSTIYERYSTINTGIDPLIELTKQLVLSGSTTYPLNTRILMKFDYADLNSLIEAGYNLAAASYSLKLYSIEQRELPVSFTIEVNAVSGSWEMGLGQYEYATKIEEGVSWIYRDGITVGTEWETTSYVAGSTGSYSLIPGGGTWYTGSALIATKSIDFNEQLDLDIDITSIVHRHLNSTIPNDGILIRRTTSNESSMGDNMSMQYFSSDTNTIYLPYLQARWNDATFNTGSLQGLNASDENVVYFKNLNNAYKTNDKATFRLVGRPKYARKTFSTSSVYAEQYYLPFSSSYSVEDLHTKETIIEHDYNYTRISCDPTSSFFNLWMDGLQPERWYKFTIRTKYSNNNVQIHDNEYIFKVNRVV
jgi:hypothetical protein